MKKQTVIALVAAALLVGGAIPAFALTGDSGVTSCEVFQKGAVKATGKSNLTGSAPGPKAFDFFWGTNTTRTYNAYGTKPSGGWYVTSVVEVDALKTNGFCSGG